MIKQLKRRGGWGSRLAPIGPKQDRSRTLWYVRRRSCSHLRTRTMLCGVPPAYRVEGYGLLRWLARVLGLMRILDVPPIGSQGHILGRMRNQRDIAQQRHEGANEVDENDPIVTSRVMYPEGEDMLELPAKGVLRVLVPMSDWQVRRSGSKLYPALSLKGRTRRAALRA